MRDSHGDCRPEEGAWLTSANPLYVLQIHSGEPCVTVGSEAELMSRDSMPTG